MQSQEGVTLAAAQHFFTLLLVFESLQQQYFKMRYQRSNGQLEQLNMCIACWSYILKVMEQMDTSQLPKKRINVAKFWVVPL